MRPGFPLGITLLALAAPPAQQGERERLLGEILQAEDHRAASPRELDLLVRALGHPDSLVVARAARALGRRERPEDAARLIPLLSGENPSVRAEAAQAIAQSAQGLRRDSSASARGAWPGLLAALTGRLREERVPAVMGILALSLGRLPYPDSAAMDSVRRELVELCVDGVGATDAAIDRCRGAEMLVRSGWRRIPLETDLAGRLRNSVRKGKADSRARRHMLGALLIAQRADDTTLTAALRAADDELRRLALTGLRRAPGEREFTDPVPAVRVEAFRALARTGENQGCARLARGASDPAPMVSLVVLDLLSLCGQDSGAVQVLRRAAERVDRNRWQRAAHAFVALARAAPAYAAPLLPERAQHPVWQVRMYAARAGALLKDAAWLERLAVESSGNVREAALLALREVGQHSHDSLFRRALRDPEYPVVLAAALALAGTADRVPAAAALLDALDRISLAASETSRDPRLAILGRLREIGGVTLSPRLVPYLRDFDPMIADSAAALLTSWTGTSWPPSPRVRVSAPITQAEVEALRGARMEFILEGGRRFSVALEVDQAPLTVVRIARLVRARYYDDKSFHRWVANFVIQGGSPGDNEYSGIPDFMRDELSSLSHTRGTLGVSTRGRDTGDGQIFVNLRDNSRLDYDYTVWGRIVSGLDVLDTILEGTVIRRAEIVAARSTP